MSRQLRISITLTVAMLLTEKGRTRAGRQVKSVKVRFPRRVRLLGRFFIWTTYFLRRIRILACIFTFLYVTHVVV